MIEVEVEHALGCNFAAQWQLDWCMDEWLLIAGLPLMLDDDYAQMIPLAFRDKQNERTVGEQARIWNSIQV